MDPHAGLALRLDAGGWGRRVPRQARASAPKAPAIADFDSRHLV